MFPMGVSGITRVAGWGFFYFFGYMIQFSHTHFVIYSPAFFAVLSPAFLSLTVPAQAGRSPYLWP